MGGSAETSICQTYVANFFEALTMGQANTQKRAYELLRTLVPNGIVGNRGDTVGSAQSSATALPSIDFTLGNDSPGHTHTYTDIFHVGSGAGKPAFKKGAKVSSDNTGEDFGEYADPAKPTNKKLCHKSPS